MQQLRRVTLALEGDSWTLATLETMARVAAHAAGTPAVRRLAAQLEGSTAGEAAAELEAWLRPRIEFREDPPLADEVIRTPLLALEQIRRDGVARLDCDDGATLVAALALAAGVPVRFVVLAFDGWQDYAHVYAELLTESGWVPLDVTESAARHDAMQARVTRRQTMRLDSGCVGCQGQGALGVNPFPSFPSFPNPGFTSPLQNPFYSPLTSQFWQTGTYDGNGFSIDLGDIWNSVKNFVLEAGAEFLEYLKRRGIDKITSTGEFQRVRDDYIGYRRDEFLKQYGPYLIAGGFALVVLMLGRRR